VLFALGEMAQTLLLHAVKPRLVDAVAAPLNGISRSQVVVAVDVAAFQFGVLFVAVAVDGQPDIFSAVEVDGVLSVVLADLRELPASFDEVVAAEDGAVVFDGQLVVA